jgi:cytochrome c5
VAGCENGATCCGDLARLHGTELTDAKWRDGKSARRSRPSDRYGAPIARCSRARATARSNPARMRCELFGPNLTGGAGSRVATFKASDWDRSVRHGVRPDGTPAVMPSIDFFAMSDRELSDLVSFIRSHPKVDRTMAPLSFGPLLNVLMATDKFRISAEVHPDHAAAHVVEAPPESDVLAFGGHLAQTCAGCHNHEFTGGPIVGGPPEWAPAANLTPAPDGLAGWTFEAFETVLRTGVKRDGQHVKLPMTLMLEPGKAMREEEIKAMWAFFQSLPPKAKGK